MTTYYDLSFCPLWGHTTIYRVEARCLEEALAKLGAECNDFTIYRPIEFLSEDEIAEYETMNGEFIYIDSTEFGGGCGFFEMANFNAERRVEWD
jgi:hypothetical protein